MNKVKMNECMVDHVNSKIWVGNSYMKKASKYGTKEYKALVRMRHDFPAYEVEIVRPKKAVDKVSMKGLSYQYMDDHIRTHYGESSANYTEFRNRMGMKEGTRNHYMSTATKQVRRRNAKQQLSFTGRDDNFSGNHIRSPDFL